MDTSSHVKPESIRLSSSARTVTQRSSSGCGTGFDRRWNTGWMALQLHAGLRERIDSGRIWWRALCQSNWESAWRVSAPTNLSAGFADRFWSSLTPIGVSGVARCAALGGAWFSKRRSRLRCWRPLGSLRDPPWRSVFL